MLTLIALRPELSRVESLKGRVTSRVISVSDRVESSERFTRVDSLV